MAAQATKKIDASKENAKQAHEYFLRIVSGGGGSDEIKFVNDFTNATMKRLPSQKSIANDRKRKRIYAKKNPTQT